MQILSIEAPGGTDGPSAQWWAPHTPIVDASLLSITQLAQAEAHETKHRLSVARPPEDDLESIAKYAGEIRHELEHVRQWNACGLAPFSLNRLALRVIGKETGLIPGTLANQVPLEADANAAASLFIRRRLPAGVAVLEASASHSVFVRSLVAPEPFNTLDARMVAYLFQHASTLERLAAADGYDTVGQFLDVWAPGSGDLWVRYSDAPR